MSQNNPGHPVRRKREPVKRFSRRIDEYVEAMRARRLSNPAPVRERVIERVVEKPVEKVITKTITKTVEVPVEVEKVVYRDHPAEKMLEELEATKAGLDAYKSGSSSDEHPRYRFNVSSLQDEFDAARDNSLQDTDTRLSKEFDDLEARLGSVNPEGLDRHSHLNSKLFRKV